MKHWVQSFLPIQGSSSIKNGIKLLQNNLIDALYHPSPIKVYHHTNELSKTIACSYFYGQYSGVYIAVGEHIADKQFNQLNDAFEQAIQQQSYESFYAQSKITPK